MSRADSSRWSKVSATVTCYEPEILCGKYGNSAKYYVQDRTWYETWAALDVENLPIERFLFNTALSSVSLFTVIRRHENGPDVSHMGPIIDFYIIV